MHELVQQLRANPAVLTNLVAPLSDTEMDALVDHLKSEADRHYWINANHSLELADILIKIGQMHGNFRHCALGMMTRGDALKFLGQIEEAWDALQEAGRLFQAAGDEVGWARTRIGRLVISVDLNCVVEALTDAERARDVFVRYAVHEKRLVLDLNTAIVYNLLGDQCKALTLYHSALATAKSLVAAGQGNLEMVYTNMGLLYTNIGNVYDLLGDFRQALTYHECARALFSERDQPRGAALAEYNSAHIFMLQGHLRRALRLLHRAHDLYIVENLSRDATNVSRDIVECYLLLNRYADARDLARQVIAAYHSFNAAYQEAYTLLHLATAEAELSNLEAAQGALDAAAPIFASLGAATWVATTQLRRGQIALKQGNTLVADREVIAAAACFAQDGQQVNYATATLVHGQALFAEGDLRGAAQSGATALRIARRSNVPPLRYSVHLLLGRIAEAQDDLVRATRRYTAAIAIVERVQRGLTITLRPSFLADKSEALRALIGLQVRAGLADRAFETLERAKSQVLLSYLANREQLRWTEGDSGSRALIEDLNRLREEHQWFYRLAHEQAIGERRQSTIEPQQALAEVSARERRMRAITEQLYLQSGEGSSATHVTPPSARDVRSHLSEDTLVVEFYNDGAGLWAFTLDSRTTAVHTLPMTVASLDGLLRQLQVNLAAALSTGPQAPVARNLTTLAQRILRRLYAVLLEPLEQRIRGHRRLVIVPYGALHYLPFHLLHTGEQYLIERYEIVVLPASGLMTRRVPTCPCGALILAHSWEGRLPQTHAEARIVQQLFGGTVYSDHMARRTVLQAQPTQILHIAAHGAHRLDQPDLSYIQLADGQLYTDDLLQHDLGYELVTLSACETGRANVGAGDELIGLGRGFLYAGAGALITSLWRITDESAVALMEQVYHALADGASKAAALRDAQRSILSATPQLHPAFWGAFQLVGDARPLSAHVASRKEHPDDEP